MVAKSDGDFFCWFGLRLDFPLIASQSICGMMFSSSFYVVLSFMGGLLRPSKMEGRHCRDTVLSGDDALDAIGSGSAGDEGLSIKRLATL
jgi:hypothetical protein